MQLCLPEWNIPLAACGTKIDDSVVVLVWTRLVGSFSKIASRGY